jgi:class 3 adenylate cyclase
MQAWHRAGLAQTVIPVGRAVAVPTALGAFVPRGIPVALQEAGRHSRAMLFGDICGFSKLTDAELPGFATHVMGTLGAVLARYRDRSDMINTWGDGVFVVFADAGVAALCALELQEAMASLDLAAHGLPTHLSLRLGGHLGPVYELHDPILARPNFYGAHVSRAARIEPIVPKGCVYVTETFAAVLALSNADALACDYVGWTDMAKKYGRLRMFLLRRRGGGLEPTVVTDIEREPVV